MTVNVHHGGLILPKEVSPKFTDRPIHIYGGGQCGYKLSVGKRCLTLSELVTVVNVYNAHLTLRKDLNEIFGG